MTLVCVIIYNRFENLRVWLNAWKQCDQTDAELIIIHNYDKPSEKLRYNELCNRHEIKYIERENSGYDIGAFKDVIEGTIQLPEYDNILWITDDTIPMSKDFVSHFIEPLKYDVGCTCLEISSKNSPLHVRTTGFCLTKEVAQKLVIKRIKSKEDCYRFEHRGGSYIMMRQIEAMGLKCVQISPIESGVLWDKDNRAYLKRQQEHDQLYYSHRKVIFICPIYNEYPAVIPSLITQTFQNWELRLIHDGPNKTGLRKTVESYDEKRVKYSETKEKGEYWGHYIRQQEINKLEDGGFVVITNGDNYHAPVFIEKLLKGFKDNSIVATYCSEMTHSYLQWGTIQCSLKRGYIDCACMMIRSEIAKEIGWNDVVSHSADWIFFNRIINAHGRNNIVKVPGNLLVHN